MSFRTLFSHRVVAYHADENKGKDFGLMRKLLLAIKPNSRGRTRSSTVLYCSPQSLDPSSKMSDILRTLAKRNLITNVFVDEAHTIHRDGQSGSSFRAEFDTAYINLLDMIATMETPPNICVMSATLRQEYQNTITKLSKRLFRRPTIVCWGPMTRRNIKFGVHIFGSPSAAIKRELQSVYETDRDAKVIVYTNSKLNAEGTLTNIAQSIIDSIAELTGVAIALTGDCGIMMKTFLMAAFCGKTDDQVAEEDMELPNVLILPATASANCGFSSIFCKRATRYSIPPNLIDIAQEMGRVDRTHDDAARGEHRYDLYISFHCVMNLFLRVFRGATAAIREFEFSELFAVLHFVVLPTKCYHVFLEEHFERPSANADRNNCGDNCSFCTSEHLSFTKQFVREELVEVLKDCIFDLGPVTLAAFLKGLTSNVDDIYGQDEALVKSLQPGNVHALALQLVAARFVEIFVDEAHSTKLGTKDLNKNHLKVKLVKNEAGRRFRINNEGDWDHHGFNYRRSTIT